MINHIFNYEAKDQLNRRCVCVCVYAPVWQQSIKSIDLWKKVTKTVILLPTGGAMPNIHVILPRLRHQ